MIDTLWALGRRLEAEGMANPFTILQPTHHYRSLVEAKEAVGKLAWKIVREGPPLELGPVVFGFFGYGHVSQGAQEIFDILPVEARPAGRHLRCFSRAGERRPGRSTRPSSTKRTWSGPSIPAKPFDLQDYYENPRRIQAGGRKTSCPYLTAVVNGIYWTPKYPEVHHQAVS